MTKRILLGAFALIAAAWHTPASATPAQQFPTNRDSWLAWLGCWQADGAPERELLCIVPDGAGVRMITLVEGAPADETRVLTDGRARRVEREGCSGTERAHWSVDGQRVFLNSDLLCEGDVARKVSGIFAITAPDQWLSVQSINIGDQVATRTVHYTAVEPADLPAFVLSVVRTGRASRAAARTAALAPADAQDVEEAVSNVDPNAVEEWLNATGQSALLPEETMDPQLPASALVNDYAPSASNPYNYTTHEIVRVVERPVYVHTTYVNTIYRSCWDPFYHGFAFDGFGLRYGVAQGGYGCRHRHYYGRYSPWGYDLFGWRFISRPVVIWRGPIIIRRPPIIIRKGPQWTDRRGPIDRREGPATRTMDGRNNPRDRTDDRNDTHGRVTRNGYSNGVVTTSGTDRWAPPRPSSGTRSTSSGEAGAPTTRHPGNGSWIVTPATPSRSAEARGSAQPNSSVRSWPDGEQRGGSQLRSRAQPRESSPVRPDVPVRSAAPPRTEQRVYTVPRSEPRSSAQPRAESRSSQPRAETRAHVQPRAAPRASAPARTEARGSAARTARPRNDNRD
jgi:hypothetical protein